MASRTVSIILTGTNASAIRAIEGTSAAAAKAGGVVDSKLGGAAQKVGSAFTKLDSSLAGFGIPFAGALGVVGAHLEQTETKTKSFAGSVSSLGGAELIAGAAGLALVGGEALKMADAFDQAHVKLETSVHNVGQSLSTESGAIKETDDRLTNLGFKSSETEAALAKLVTASGSVAKATALMGVAADISRFKNISLADSAQILVNAEAGRLKGLGAIIGTTKDASGKTLTFAAALQKVEQLTGGQALAYLDTYAGKLEKAGAKSEDLGVKLGKLEKVAIGGIVDKTLTAVNGFQAFNSALDGIPGKVVAIGAAFPAVFFAGEKLVALGTKIGESFLKVGRAVTGITTAAETAGTVGAGTAATASNVAAAGSADALAASNAAATASFVGMSGAELAAAAATGTISAEELAVVLATQELNAALLEVASTSDIDAVAIDRLTAANTALAVAEHEAALAGAEQAAAGAGGAAAGGAAAGAEGLGLGAATVAAPSAVVVPLGAAAVAAGGIEAVRTAEHLLQADTSKTAQSVKDLASAFELLDKSGKNAALPDALSKPLGDNFEKLAHAIKENDTNTTGFLGRFSDGVTKFLGVTTDAKQKIVSTKNALIDLFKVDPQAAISAYGRLFAALRASGVPAAVIGSDFEDLIKLLGTRVSPAAHAAASAVFDLGTAFDALAGKTGALAKADELSTIADKFDAVNTAQAKVAADKADLTGTSKNAQEANRAEADALRGLRDANQSVSDSHQRLSDSYQGLQDAQDRVKTSAHSLLEAQQALEEFNSARGARERTLALDIIQRRVAPSPIEQDQKQLDLLKFQDENKNKQQSLTDAVASAQKGLVDANRGVEQAQRGIADAERGIGDATQKVADAQRSVSDAVAKRRAVHDDAAKAIGADERASSKAVAAVVDEIKKAKDAQLLGNAELGNYLTLLKAVADEADPGGALTKNIDQLISKMQLSAVLAQKAKDDALKQPVGPAGPIGPEGAPGVGPAGSTGPGGIPLTVRAEGGPVVAHKPILVGEKGPELFVPKTAAHLSTTILTAGTPGVPGSAGAPAHAVAFGAPGGLGAPGHGDVSAIAPSGAPGVHGVPGYGAAGAPGLAGTPGHPGIASAFGAPGAPGIASASAVGVPGAPGAPGIAASVAYGGTAGAPGRSGAAGAAGRPGAPAHAKVSAVAASGAPGIGIGGKVGAPGAPVSVFVSPTVIAASNALKGHAIAAPPATKPIVIGVNGPTIFVPPSVGLIVPHDKLAATAAGKNDDLKGYASGGLVDPKQPIIVGEKGPELFVPKASPPPASAAPGAPGAAGLPGSAGAAARAIAIGGAGARGGAAQAFGAPGFPGLPGAPASAVAAPGLPGTAGASARVEATAGRPGAAGLPGEHGAPGAPARAKATATASPGIAGLPGQPGDAIALGGAAGLPGVSGASGGAARGVGADGLPGIPGAPATAAPGVPGSPGAAARASSYGAPGTSGAAGRPGAPARAEAVGIAGTPGAPASVSVTGSPVTIAARATLKGHTAPGPASTTKPIVVGIDGPHVFVPLVAGTIVSNDKLAITAVGKNDELKGYATGGPVAPNKPVVVGEKGPEIFVPQSAGAIVSNAKVASVPPNVTYASNTTTSSTASPQPVSSPPAVVQHFVTNQFPKAVTAVEKFSTVIALAATKADEAQKATAGYAKAQETYNVERATRAAKVPAVPVSNVSVTTPATVVTSATSSFTKELSSTASSLKTFDTELVKFQPFVPLPRPSTPSVSPSSGSPQAQSAQHVTFANTYHINAHDTPTKTELDAINREQSWRLTQSGRR